MFATTVVRIALSTLQRPKWLYRFIAMLGAFGVVRASPEFDVRDFGAKGDGRTLDTASISRAIEACAAAGGGTVRVPAGTFVSGTIELKSNITLRLEAGATLAGTSDLGAYRTALAGQSWLKALVLARGASNVAVVGHGTIDGRKVFDPAGEERMRGPHALLFYDCQNITVRDIAVHDAGNYAVILRSCEGVMVDGLSVEGGWDGVNMHDTKNATLSNCRLATGDDCLAGRFWEDVVVTNCVLNSSANAIRVGGRNVLFNNLVIRGPGKHPAGTSLRHRLECGFQILPNRLTSMKNKYAAVGPVDNMVLSNITMIDVGTPVWIDYGPGAPYSKESLGVGRIIMNGLTVLDAGLVPFYVGAPAENPVGSIVLSHVRLSYRGGAEERLAQGQGFSPFSVLQAFGMYFRNVAHVELSNVHIDCREPEMRTPLFVENVGRLELREFTAQRRENEFPLLQSVGKCELRIGGREAAAAVGRVTALLLPEGPVRVNDYFPITMTMRNEGAAGLASVELRLGAERLARAVWLEAGETAKVSFLNVRGRQAGAIDVMAGEMKRPLRIEPRLEEVKVAAPFEFFHNTDAQAWQNTEGYYLKAAGDNSVLQFGDQYGALRRAAALPDNGTVVVKLENPDLRTSWYGRVGLMVRADITKPGKSGGYLVLGSSPANGSALEWDADGDGRLERHTAFDGHTTWPHWLKLVRTGRHFVGYRSRDGVDWDKIGEAEVPSATGRLDVGLFAFRSSGFFRAFEVRE